MLEPSEFVDNSLPIRWAILNDAGETSARVPIGRCLNLGEAKPSRVEDGLGWEATRRKLESGAGVLLFVCLWRVGAELWDVRTVAVSSLDEAESILISFHPF